MDGELALKYARTRHSGRGDFDRAARQQQVLMAILDKVTRLNLLPQLLPQVPQMWETVRDSVVMDPEPDAGSSHPAGPSGDADSQGEHPHRGDR